MQPRATSDRLRLAALVLVSVLFHAALLWWVRAQTPPAEPARAQRPLELELAWLEPEPPAPPAPTRPPPPAPSVRRAADVAPKAPAAAAAPEVGAAENDTASAVGTRGDLPLARGVDLTPGLGFVLKLPVAQGGEPSRGTTIRNGPGEAPDQASLLEYTGEVLSRRMTSDLQQDVARAAVEAGNVPTHFKRYESAMRTALPGARIDRTPLSTGDQIRDAASIVFNDGPSAAAARKVTDTPLGRSVAQQSVMLPNVEDQRSREASLQMMAQLENLKERISRARLRTVLEVTTDASGALADVSVIERSGDARFDESVLHFSRKVARTLPDADDKLLGTSLWRTRWQFTWEPPEVRVKLLNAWRVPGTAQ